MRFFFFFFEETRTALTATESNTGLSHNNPPPLPTLRGGLAAKKGNEDTPPSVLYVARLELYSRGAGWEPGCGGLEEGGGRGQRGA